MSVRTPMIAAATDAPDTFRLALGGIWVPNSALNVRTGVTSTPVLTGTGSLTCTVSAFNCIIDGTSNALQGSYPAALDTATTVTINTGSASARIDLISLQIQDNAFDGSGQHQGVIVYTAGTPGSGSPPAAPANSISLWTVPVGALATSVNFASATAVFPFTAAAGGIVPVRSAADQPAVVNGVQYRHRLDVTASAGAVTPLESSTNGTTWKPVFDPAGMYGAWTNTTVSGAFNVTQQPQYRTAPGNMIELRGAVTSNTNVGPTAGVIGGVPAPANDRFMPSATNIVGGAVPYMWLQNHTTTIDMVSASGVSYNAGTVFGFDGLSYSL